jgi:L-lactate dehydrogenase complex protein LldF
LKLAGIGQGLLPRVNGMIRRLPPPMQGWTMSRDLHPLAEESFMEKWRKTRGMGV